MSARTNELLRKLQEVTLDAGLIWRYGVAVAGVETCSRFVTTASRSTSWCRTRPVSTFGESPLRRCARRFFRSEIRL